MSFVIWYLSAEEFGFINNYISIFDHEKAYNLTMVLSLYIAFNMMPIDTVEMKTGELKSKPTL